MGQLTSSAAQRSGRELARTLPLVPDPGRCVPLEEVSEFVLATKCVHSIAILQIAVRCFLIVSRACLILLKCRLIRSLPSQFPHPCRRPD